MVIAAVNRACTIRNRINALGRRLLIWVGFSISGFSFSPAGVTAPLGFFPAICAFKAAEGTMFHPSPPEPFLVVHSVTGRAAALCAFLPVARISLNPGNQSNRLNQFAEALPLKLKILSAKHRSQQLLILKTGTQRHTFQNTYGPFGLTG